MGMIKGIAVTIYQKTDAGKDAFNRAIISETPVVVQNVLVGLPTESEILESTNLTGRRADFTLGIPKGDTHDWVDIDVDIFGERFHTVGAVVRGLEEMVPLAWHKKVMVTRVNGREEQL